MLYSNGRIDGAMTTPKAKNSQPLPYADAVKLFEKIEREKRSGGYTDPAGAVCVQSVPTAADQRDTGIYCQLLNETDEAGVKQLIGDDTWAAQEKFDGKRVLIECAQGQATGINRKGRTCGLPAQVAASAIEFARLYGDSILDGELIGENYFVFDLLKTGGRDQRTRPFIERYRSLSARAAGLQNIKLSDLTTGREAKEALFARMREENREGIVFKRLDAPYSEGRPNSGGDQIKFCFLSRASVIVTEINQKRSFSMSVIDGSGAKIKVGNCTVPANKAIPQTGAVVEVRYKYAFAGGSLFQPFYLGLRDDLSDADCLIGQLKYKRTEGEAEDDAALAA